MKKTLLLSALMLVATAVQGQTNVRRAVETLMAAGPTDEEPTTEVCGPTEGDPRRSTTWRGRFHLPVTQRRLLDDVYQAFDLDSACCTQYRRQDAFSAHNRPVDISVPGRRLNLKVDSHVNLLWGGFFDIDGITRGHQPGDQGVFDPSKTLYRYYVLTWQPDSRGGIDGSLTVLSFEADTQRPDVRPVTVPKYDALRQAVRTFTSRQDIPLVRSLSFRRAAADGQWTHLYHTYGFNIPLTMERDVLLPLYEAFEATKGRAYRYLNKPAGEEAPDVQIVVREDGSTIGLGLQTQWNIVYAYFTDEDYPRNRYVYALWYRPDVPRRRIVGELFVIDTPRPDGGSVVRPYVQRTVPSYLWRLGQPDVPRQLGMDLDGLSTDVILAPDVQTMALILSAWDEARGEVDPTFPSHLRQRGVDIDRLSAQLDTMARNAEAQRQALLSEMDATSESHRRALHSMNDMLKQNLPSGTFDRMTTEQRQQYFDQIRREYAEAARTLTDDFRSATERLKRKYPSTSLHFFGPDSLPTPFTRHVEETLTSAYRGDGSRTDAQLAARLRLFADLSSRLASTADRTRLLHRLDSLRHIAPTQSARVPLTEAMRALGSSLPDGASLPDGPDPDGAKTHYRATMRPAPGSAKTHYRATMRPSSPSSPLERFISSTYHSVIEYQTSPSDPSDSLSMTIRREDGKVIVTLPNGTRIHAGSVHTSPPLSRQLHSRRLDRAWHRFDKADRRAHRLHRRAQRILNRYLHRLDRKMK